MLVCLICMVLKLIIGLSPITLLKCCYGWSLWGIQCSMASQQLNGVCLHSSQDNADLVFISFQLSFIQSSHHLPKLRLAFWVQRIVCLYLLTAQLLTRQLRDYTGIQFNFAIQLNHVPTQGLSISTQICGPCAVHWALNPGQIVFTQHLRIFVIVLIFRLVRWKFKKKKKVNDFSENQYNITKCNIVTLKYIHQVTSINLCKCAVSVQCTLIFSITYFTYDRHSFINGI